MVNKNATNIAIIEFFKNNFDNNPKLSCDLLIEAHRKIPMNCQTTYNKAMELEITSGANMQYCYDKFIDDSLNIENKNSNIQINDIEKLGKWYDYYNLSKYTDNEKKVMAQLFSGGLEYLFYNVFKLINKKFDYIFEGGEYGEGGYFDIDNIDFGYTSFEEFTSKYK
jgi:hypothetical protein